MKTPYLLFSILIVLAACNEGRRETPAPAADTLITLAPDTAVRDEAVFPELYAWIRSNNSEFNPQKLTSGFEVPDSAMRDRVDSEMLARWKPFLLFNADSSLALDLHSRSDLLTVRNGKTVIEEGEPDTDIGLIRSGAGTRERLFYGGPSSAVLGARWLDAHTLALAIADVIDPTQFVLTVYRNDTRSGDRRIWVSRTLKGNAAAYGKNPPRAF